MVITLRRAQLDDDNEQFKALSYAWGEKSPTYEIIIRDGTQQGSLRIRQNLHDFLLAARVSAAKWGIDWIWIDQICINQGNHDERCHQVDQMARLYSTSQATIAWSGLTRPRNLDPEEGGKECTDSILSFEELEMIQNRPDEPIKNIFRPSEPVMRLLELFTWDMLSRTVRSSYWSRLWVIQEIILAPETFVILADEPWHWGTVYSAVNILLRDARDLRLSQWEDDYWALRPLSLHLMVVVVTKSAMKSASLARNNPNPKGKGRISCNKWADVLPLSARLECEMPLDRIYGLMGLLNENLRVPADYTISPRQLLKNIIRKEIAFLESGSDEILGRIHALMDRWNFFVGLELIRPPGLITEPSELFHLGDVTPGWRRTIEHNVPLILQELQIPLPVGTAATPHNGGVETVPPLGSPQQLKSQTMPNVMKRRFTF